MIFVAARGFSQDLVEKSPKMLLLQATNKPIASPVFSITKFTANTTVTPVIAPDFYVTQLGFFCKQEIKLEKATKIPFRFRLGSVEDCDRMEGKHRRSVSNL